uniref:Dynein heavy chain tail domain-containing protein n=1 Tax=Anopheles stephensi TaxID=30069 RepID=A0A182Y5Q8_ANOST
MATEHEGDMSEISSLTDSSDEGKKVVEEVVEAVEEIDKPAYSDEDLETLVGFIRGMIILFDYEDDDFNEEVAETIKLWLTDVNNPLLFIFYDGNRLSASLAFPLCPINDLMYFMREPEQLFNVLERFHDDILFGTLHGDIEGSLLVQLEQVYGPMILSNVDWSENVKANVINGFNAFMTYLTELHYKLSGFTLLYVPREGSDMEVQEVVLNRSMIKRLEAVVIDWTGQIRATLSDTQHFVPDDLVCPSDEYSFWLYRHEVLTAIRLQYKGPNVQHIVRILELAQSLYIKHLKDVLEDLDKEIEIAESNIPFLKLLVDPCFAIGTLETADDFCSQLIYVMHIIRFIGQDSHYLNKDESITKLFLYLSNEIVACCMRGIDIDRILAGAPRYGIEVCRMKINCCESYKIIYEEMLEHFKGEFTWNLDYAAIFNRINAFLQRLNDILEICDAMLIFGKYAESTAYTSYRFFCNNAEEFERRCDQVEKIFHNALETIESVGSTILDINNKDWYRYIGEFREMLKSLDDIIENLLSNVFLMSENLEEKLNVLVTLLNFYKRENIRESFMRKIGEVWSMLNDEIMQLSKDVSAGITEYPALLPPHAGRYAVLKMRFDHLTHLRTLIVNCRFFPEYPQQEEVLALYEACEKQVKAALKGFSESWNKSITTDMASWYQRNLICRSNLRPGLFEVNIERRLLVLFDEAYYFKTLGVNVPMSLDLEKHENTRLTFDNVLRLVLYFNGVVSSISDKERLFFKPMIQQTERKLEPLRSKLTWEEDLSEFIEGYVVNVRELLDLIELYKRENHKISSLVERIYTMIFVRLDQQHPVNMAQLMTSVAEQKKTVFTELLEVLTEVSKNIFTVYDSLGSNIRKMGTIWEQYLHKIDKLLKAAIFTCTLNTLRGVQTSLENAHSCPILMIEILLKKEGAVYEPSVEAVEQTLRRLPEEVCLTIRPVPSMARRYQLDNGERSFYLQLLEHPDYIQITRSIDETINDTVRLLRTYQSKWNVFRPFWCVDKAAFIERFKLTAMTSDAFQKNIEKFEELQNQLVTQGDFVVCRSVEIDALKLKYALTSHIGEWQTNYIEYLKCIAYGKIIDFNNILKQNIEELRHEPMEVYELKQLEQRYQTCFAELPEKEQEIALILKYFVVLEKYVADLLPEAYELRRNIDQIWAQYQADLKAIREQIENYQDQFKLSMTGAADALKALREIRSKLENLRQVWILVKEWRIERDRIMAESYSTADEIELNVMSGHFRQTYAILAEGPIGNEAFDVFSRVGEEISHFCVTVTIVCTMRASFMQERHWLKVKEIARCGEANELPGELCSFHAMTELGLYNYEEELLDLCFAARKEHEVELDLQTVALQVRAIEFRIRQASGGAGFLELRNPGTHFTTLSDNIGIINRLRRSAHRHPYQSLIDYWEHTLGLIEEMLEIIVRMESECRTLHELHRITRGIARGSKMDHFNDGFRECFAEWCELMRYISSVRLVEDVCPVGQEFIAELESVRKRLNQQANALNDVLGEQREVFPRFYLLSDSQLVRLISAPLNYTQLEQSLPMLYENVTRFHLLERGKQNAPGIGGVYTRDQEFVPFAEAPADPQREPDGVTEFMNVLECHIHGAMQDLLSSCHTALRRGYFRRVESGWLRSWPLQLCLKSAELQHTLHTRNALVQCSLLGNKKPLKMLRALHTKLLQELTASAGKQESQWQSKKLHDLLVLELNARDLIGRLCRRKELHGLETFEWISQLHSYWHPTGRKCFVQLLNARFSYGYECKRSTEPMLLTPVSERARMVTICALNFHQISLLLSTSGGCGGRQVLLESLAHSLGAFLLTVECDENSRMEYLMRIVNGMKMVGGWLVFRCFERLPNSIVAQIGDHAREIIISQRKPVTISRFQMFALTSSGCRITNRKMAEQLDRTLFRPVHFTTVDRVKVIESWLWLAGCDHSTRIAKLTEVFLRQPAYAVHRLIPNTLRKSTQPRVFDREWLDNLIQASLSSPSSGECIGRKCLIFDSVPCSEWIDCVAQLARPGHYVSNDFTPITTSGPDRDVKVIVECVGPLRTMTPSSVSHFALVHIGPDDLGWQELVDVWLEQKPQILLREQLQELVRKNMEPLLSFRRQECRTVAPIADVSLVRTFCQLCDSLLAPFDMSKVWRPETGEPMLQRWSEALVKVFFFCAVWSVGGSMDDEGARGRYDLLIREQHPEAGYPLKGNVYQFYVDLPEGTWRPWDTKLQLQLSQIPTETVDGDSQGSTIYRSPYVRSPQTIAHEFLVKAMMRNGAPVLVASETAVGKTALVQTILSELDQERWASMRIALTQRTTQLQLRKRLRCHALKIMKTRLYPENRKRMVCFFDDLHTARANPYAVDEFIRDFSVTSGWYESATPMCIEQCQTVLAMRLHQCHSPTPPVMQSLLNKCHLLVLTPPADEQLGQIFTDMILSTFGESPQQQASVLRLLAPATVDFVRRLTRRLPPTPTRLRYQFSLQTIATIVRSVCHCLGAAGRDAYLAEKAQLLRLWIHECYRESWDRLERADHRRFYELLNETVSGHFEVTLHGLCPNNQSPIFTDMMHDGKPGKNPYEDVRDFNQLITHVEERWSEVSDDSTKTVIIHREAIQHATKMLRNVRLGLGGMVLMGQPGSGRTVVCQLAARLSPSKPITFHRLDVKARDAPEAIESEFSRLFQVCLGQPGTVQMVMVNLDDTVEAEPNERLMELLGGIIAGEELGVLFCDNTSTEQQTHSNPGEGTKERVLSTMDSWQKARRRESLVESTESRLQKSTHDLLFRIHYAVQTEAILPTAAKRNIIAPCSWYFELLDTFERVLREKRLELQALHRKFRIGIERIEDATQKVANLSEELQQRQREIATFQEQLDEFLEEIDRQTKEADEQTEEVSVKRVKIGAEEVVCKQLAEVAGADLQRAMPALNAAVAALDSLNKKDMNEIKSYSRPPTRVELVMEAVMILLGKEPTWAESKRQLGEQKFLDTLKGFDRNNITERTLKTIGGYVRNPDLEPDKVGTVSKAAKSLMLWVRAIENYGKVYKFVGPKIRKMEDANASLLEKQNELAAAERKLIELAEKLAQLRAEYDAKMAEKLLLEETARQMALKLERARNLVNNLAGECTRWLATKSELESTYARLIGDTLLAAGYLTYLGPVNLETRTNLLAQWLIDLEMHETPFTPKFSLTAYFYDPGVLIRWHENGLPPDDFSAENATILMKSTRVALIVDPQEEAQKWMIAELEGRVKLVDFDDEICESTLVEAFERHEPLMVENVNCRNVSELDELFTLRDTVATSCCKCRQKNQSSEMAHPLYLVGQEPLRMSGALVKRVNQLSFVLAAEGLEMKMLGLLVQSENPSLEERKELLQQTILQNKKTLVDLEEQILRILNESKIPLLEDEELYRVLESSRATFETVSSGLQQAEKTRLEIETSREVYRSCAARSALLFLVLGDLQLFNPLYRYSLEWYQALFLISLERSGRVQQVAERKRRIDDYHTFNVFRIVSRGLFENDRKLFAFYLCVRLLFAEEALSPREFRFLIFGAGKIDRQEQMENPCRSWLTDSHWDQLTDLDRLPGFHGIVESFAELPDDWRQWYLSSVPEVSPLPGSWEINLKQFQKYLIVRSLRLDRIENCMSDFTRDTLGVKYVNVPVGSLDDAYQESTSHTLVLLLLRGNSNPLAKLERLARKAHGSPTEEGAGKKCFETLAITEDRMEAFIGLLRRCIMDEAWLYVSDCHLSVAFLKQLPHVVAFLKRNNLNSKFRLWLSSQPHEALPLSVLQNCIKLAYEEPKVLLSAASPKNSNCQSAWNLTGIKRHMGNLYDEIGEARFKKSTAAMKGSSTNASTETHYKRLLFAMAFLHGLLLERNNFQQLGWIEPYQFVNNDFCLAESLVSYGLEKLLVKKAPDPRHQRGKGGRTKASSADVSLEDDFHGLDQGEDEQQHDATPWQFIKGAALELCYGAQIGSRWDRRIYETYLEELFESRLLAPTTVAAPSPTPRGWFRMPRDGPYQTYVEFIGTQLPDRDGIDVFGQHENANIKYLKSRSDYMLQMLTRVAKDPSQHGSQQQQQPQQHAGQDHERTTQTISDLLSTLPVYLDYENALRIVGAGANRTSVADALLAEVRTYNAILARVRSDCHCLSRMLTGATNELLDEESDRWSVLLGALQLNKVPERWAKGGDAETSFRTVEIRVSLSDWVLQLRERVQYFRRWTETGQLPVEILLGRFTDPNRFLSGVLQLHAKAYGIPFEELRWDFTIYTTNKPLERIPIQDGFIARGLKLENGSWDWEKQTLTVPDILEMTCPLPPVAFRPVRRSGQSGEISERSPYYECPVFYSPERSEDAFILTLPLLVGEQQDAEAWAMFNTALLLND